MDPRRGAWTAIEVLSIAVVAALLVGQLLGTPVLFGYVETGSMAPTLEPGDGFVAVPSAIAGPPEEGDVVTFRAEELQGGGLTTHRIVGETERGYITKGDANPFTDQAGDEPPVKKAQIVAYALQVNGHVVVIPHLGTAVTGMREAFTSVQRRLAILTGMRSFLGGQGVAYLLLGLSLALYVVDLFVDEGRDRTRSRDRDDGLDGRLVVAGLALLLVVSATAAMTVPAGTQSFGVVSAEFESERPTVIPAGESSTLEYRIPNGGLVPVHAYVVPASEGVAVEPTHQYVPGRATRSTSVTLQAPAETGYYRRFVTEHRYLALLPSGVIDSLYRLHPWAPLIALDALLAGGIAGLGRALLRGRRVRVRTRDRSHHRSLVDRVVRAITGR
ncbi:MAG: S26 family signal peptidase [Halanaeroarchaeum sp.]